MNSDQTQPNMDGYLTTTKDSFRPCPPPTSAMKKVGPICFQWETGGDKFSHCAFQLMAYDAKCLKNTWVISINPIYINISLFIVPLPRPNFILSSKCKCSHFQKKKKSGYSCLFVILLVSYVKSCDTKSIPTTTNTQLLRRVVCWSKVKWSLHCKTFVHRIITRQNKLLKMPHCLKD